MVVYLVLIPQVPGLFDQHERALLIQNCRSLVNSVDPVGAYVALLGSKV